MSDTPIYDKLMMEFQEPGAPRWPKIDNSHNPMDAVDEAAQEEIDEAAMGDPDAEYDRQVDEELSDE